MNPGGKLGEAAGPSSAGSIVICRTTTAGPLVTGAPFHRKVPEGSVFHAFLNRPPMRLLAASALE